MAFEDQIAEFVAISNGLTPIPTQIDAAIQELTNRKTSADAIIAYWTPIVEYYEALAAGGTAPPAPIEGDILGDDGQVDNAKMTALVSSYWTEAAINYRLGTPSAPIAGLPTWSTPADTAMPPGHDNRVYQFGAFQDGYTDYSSTDVHVAFVPDNPVVRIGVAGINGMSMDHNTASVRPILNWTRYGAGMDAVEAQYWRDHGHPNMGKPVAITRGEGRDGWNVQSTVFFQDGSFCNVGTNTDLNVSFGQLPSNKKVTAAATMSSDEFILATVWDINTNQAEIAVIMKCGLGSFCTIENPKSDQNDPAGWWHEWPAAYPGLYNLGNNVFFKIVGYLPLVGMKAPTGISCQSGMHPGAYLQGDDTLNPNNLGNWEADESQRLRWCLADGSGRPQGDRASNLVRQGVAMVWSKSEKKVGFYDLKPIFDYLNKYYFGTRSQFMQTRDIGQGPMQWPFSFDVAPEQKPVFIKNIDLPGRPTAGRVTKTVDQNAGRDTFRQAWLALDNERMWTFNLGGYAQPNPDGAPIGAVQGNPSLLVKAAETVIPKNVTSITQTKFRGSRPWLRDWTRSLVLTSREEKSVSMYDMVEPLQPGVFKWKMQDSRWVDPVFAEDLENHGTESFIIDVADFNGKCVWGAGWGPITMHTQGGAVYPMLNNEQFNNFGKFDIPGKPWSVFGPNVS